ncbi:MAG TPA: DUF4215 domain-containing protein [Polyangia bacterium]
MNFSHRTVLICATLGLLGGGCANVAAPDGQNGSPGSGGTPGGGPNIDAGPIRADIKTFETPITPGNCGNGQHDDGEECDDHNTNDGDGCTRLCQVEQGYHCEETGPCDPPKCGDGVLAASESCDDGNTNDNDGCSANCKEVDKRFQCRVPGKRCVPVCGDGHIVGSENCDDGNTNDNDGCSSLCLKEPGATCTGEPSKCTKAVCGDGTKQEGESCDCGTDPSKLPMGCAGVNGLFYGDGKGCSKTCTNEPTCRDSSGANIACKAVCGDGNFDQNGGEECDDGNMNDHDGCSHDCKKENGFDCSTMMNSDLVPCKTGSGMCLELPVTYRDFKSEKETGGHPDFFYHSTSRPCVPNSAGPSHCGDATARCWGIVKDDLKNGKPQLNGSPTCACQFTDWSHDTNGGHVPGYTISNSPLNGMPYVAGPNGHPQYKGTVAIVKSETTFNQWYNDSSGSNPPNSHVVSTLELTDLGNNRYQFSSNPDSVQGGFFPLDPTPAPTAAGNTAAGEPLLCNLWPYWYSSASFGAGNGCKGDQYAFPPSIPAAVYTSNSCANKTPPGCIDGAWIPAAQGHWHNAWFTDEVHYYFTFTDAGVELQFYGDDDMFIFINGKLVVDLGSIHQRIPGKVTVAGNTGNAHVIEGGFLDATGNITACPSGDPLDPMNTKMCAKPVAMTDCRERDVNLGLKVGSTYEIAIFGADRGATESNYQLTLNAFATNKTVCTPRCGDGAISGGEECDCGDGTGSTPDMCNGQKNDDSVYGGCTTKCKYGPYCGDGNVDKDHEACDEGQNNGATYIQDKSKGGCSVTCQLPHFCGDGHVDTAYHEQCDLGDNNGKEIMNGAKKCVVCDDKCQLVTEC